MAKKMAKTHTSGMTKDGAMAAATARAKQAGHGKGTTTADAGIMKRGTSKMSMSKKR